MQLTTNDSNVFQAKEIGESSLSSLSAPPGFSFPIYKEHEQNSLVGFVHLPYDADPVIMEKGVVPTAIQKEAVSDETILGKEGAHIWKTHFAPTSDNKHVIQVPFEWVNFLSVALLS